MPKSAKKRREKAADFSKAKLKLGKGKQTPSNSVDTSFKARSIALPSQSIAVDKDDSIPTTKRRLTFDNLIVHLKHYSPGTRKDAILGLRELLDDHWDLVDANLTVLIQAVARLIGDEDASVRKTLLSFLSWFFPRVPIEDIVPHSPLLLLFTTSAQTHIFPEIRVDAIRFLNVLLDRIPDTLVDGWDQADGSHGDRILKGYLGLLSAGTKFGDTDGLMTATSTASVVLTHNSKLVVLQSLSNFLRHALTSPSSTGAPDNRNTASATLPTWYLEQSFGSSEAYETFSAIFQPSTSNHTRLWKPEANPSFLDGEEDFVHNYTLGTAAADRQWDLHYVADAVRQLEPGTDLSRRRDLNVVMNLARALYPTLVSTFLDCAPAVFSPSASPPETELQLIISVAEISRVLFGAIIRDSSDQKVSHDLSTFLGYMAPFFPFHPSGKVDVKTEQVFQDLNLIYCELTSSLVFSSLSPSRSGPRKTQAAKRNALNGLPTYAAGVKEYVLRMLRGDTPGQITRPLTYTAYISLLPTIWALITHPTLDDSNEVLHGTLQHAINTSSRASSKKAATEFVARLILLTTERQFLGRLRFGKDDASIQQLTKDWILHLPRTLWEVGMNSLALTEVILRFLLRIIQRNPTKVMDPPTVSALASQLCPYFSITHPVKKVQLPGPYSKLPGRALRRLALDVVAVLSAPSTGAPRSVILDVNSAVKQAVSGTEDEAYWSRTALAG